MNRRWDARENIQAGKFYTPKNGVGVKAVPNRNLQSMRPPKGTSYRAKPRRCSTSFPSLEWSPAGGLLNNALNPSTESLYRPHAKRLRAAVSYWPQSHAAAHVDRPISCVNRLYINSLQTPLLDRCPIWRICCYVSLRSKTMLTKLE